MPATLAAHLDTALAMERCDAPEAALRAYEAALAEAPGLAEAHFNRANLLRRLGRHTDALGGYNRALALRPRWAAAHINRGALLSEAGSAAEAVASYRKAARLEPRNQMAWANLGNALNTLGRHTPAILALRAALRLAPAAAIAHFNLGNALTSAGRRAEAAQCFLTALRIEPGFARAAVNLSARLRELGAPEAALQAADLAVHALPDLPQAHLAQACVHYDLGRFTEAETCLRRALALQPGWAVALANLGLVRAAAGRPADALCAYNDAISVDPGNAQARFGRATCLLSLGDFARGWAEFAARSAMPDAQSRGFTQPVWRGETAPGRTLLIHAEQGLGDTLQFVRFAPRAAALSGARMLLEVQPELVRLLRCLPGIHQIVPRGELLPRFDLHVPMLDLAGIFVPSPEALVPAAPYIAADKKLVAERRLAAAGGALRVGLVWAGQSRPGQPHAHAMDRRRSVGLTEFAPLAPLCRAGALKLFSLQHGPQASQLDAPPEGLVITDAMAGVSDFADTAAIVAQLDLVIGVDTSTVHLAAAMGRKTWLLSRADACWRWMHGRTNSPWYPTMTLFRQDAPGDWSGVIARVVVRLLGGVH